MGMRVRLAVCALLAGLAIAGCGPTNPTSASATPSASASSPAVTSPPLAVAGPPSTWAKRMGKHVVVEPPTVDPALNTPQGVVDAYVKHLVSKDGGSACAYLILAAAQYCIQGYQKDVAAGDDITYAYKSFGLGYTAIYDANKALVGTVRTGFCDQPMQVNCVADNSNPRTLLDSGQTFAALWKASHAPDGGYLLTPLVKRNGTWLIDTAAILGG